MNRGWRLPKGIAAVVVVVATFWVVLPLLAGAPWSLVAAAVRSVPYLDLALLGALWIAGLGLHTFTLTAALPRLTHRRAMTLSLTGSAIANLLPLGGAAGVAMNFKMARSWGFSRSAIATYTVVTNVWDVLAKLCVPAVALGWLLISGWTVSKSLLATAVGASVLLLVLSGVICAVLVSPRIARWVGAGLDWVVSALSPFMGSASLAQPGSVVVRLQGDCAALIGRAWPRLTAGIVTYNVSLCLLLWGCMHVTDAHLAVPAVVAGFAVERLLTLTGVTPGGAGVVEVGLSGLLVLFGGAPLPVVAGVLLYRLFTFGLEIPVGGLGLVGWLISQRRPIGGLGS